MTLRNGLGSEMTVQKFTADVSKDAVASRLTLPAKLVVVAGASEGIEVALTGATVVGSDPACDLQLDDPTVSRRHVAVSVAGDRIKVVINRYLKNSEISLQDAEKALEGKIYWTIPNDYPSTMSAINQGKPLTQSASKSPIVKNIMELSDQLLHRERDLKKKKWKLFNRG